jgi:DNA recombination protein RmuC
MNNEIIFLVTGLIAGGILAWIIASLKLKSGTVSKQEYETISGKLNLLNAEFSVEKEKVRTLEAVRIQNESELKIKSDEIKHLSGNLSSYSANLDSSNNTVRTLTEEIKTLKSELQSRTDEFNEANKKAAELSANLKSAAEKLETQKSEMEGLRKQFMTEFENIAAKILDDKTKKFTDLNKDNLESILKPLGENLTKFKEKVEEVYDKESKERFSLGREVEKLVIANMKISEEANNLTNALTSNSKTQGDWGQMILESILEKSGLVNGREYFIQEYLKDENGNYLLNDLGMKMQPDVIVAYPDNRKVIVDSKVSLTAYNRYISSSNKEEESKALTEHLKSIKRHIDDLSAKSYQDFAPSLDFVMMFVPVEPAYLIAVNTDEDLWSYAYNKRILLTSPSNLIVALKMIVDLWKRDNQSKNHQAIVERGGKLYDKFASVLESIKDIGSNLKATHNSYNKAVSQLSEGNDNVIKQVEKLKTLGAKAKKNLPEAESFPRIDFADEDDNDSDKQQQG